MTFGKPDEEIFTTRPFLCVEISSSGDAVLELRVKIDEYLRFGVRYFWVIEPIALTGEVHSVEGIDRVSDGIFRAGNIEVDITNI